MTPAELLAAVLSLALGFGATGWLTRRYDLRRPNFRRERIPAVFGLVFVLAGEFFYACEWLWQGIGVASAAAFFLVTLGFGVLGLLDDVRGDRSVGGFRGHFRALARGRLTTGAAKALGGGVVSLVAGGLVGYPVWPNVLLAALLIALSANTLNLFDLRPGRCLFAFFVGAATVIATLLWHGVAAVGFLFYFAVAVAFILYPLDAGGRVMLGDTGANAFGAVLGLAGALYFSPPWQAAVVVSLAAFQVWCERYSLSQAIERHPVLRRLDRKIGVR